MNTLIIRLGSKLHPIIMFSLLLGLNMYWVGILNSFGSYFEEIAGAPLLDLQNTMGILSAEAAQDLISSYSDAARPLYWSFFIMDNIMPPLVFGAFALLWVTLLHRDSRSWTARFLSSPLLLVPLGVGVFDWWENLAFLKAVMIPSADDVRQTLQIGLIFVWLKAICLYATFLVTAVLLVYRIAIAIGNRLLKA